MTELNTTTATTETNAQTEIAGLPDVETQNVETPVVVEPEIVVDLNNEEEVLKAALGENVVRFNALNATPFYKLPATERDELTGYIETVDAFKTKYVYKADLNALTAAVQKFLGEYQANITADQLAVHLFPNLNVKAAKGEKTVREAKEPNPPFVIATFDISGKEFAEVHANTELYKTWTEKHGAKFEMDFNNPSQRGLGVFNMCMDVITHRKGDLKARVAAMVKTLGVVKKDADVWAKFKGVMLETNKQSNYGNREDFFAIFKLETATKEGKKAVVDWDTATAKTFTEMVMLKKDPNAKAAA